MVDVRIDQVAFQRAMKHAPENLYRELRKAWKRHHNIFHIKVKNERLSGRPGLKRQTGTLIRGLIVVDQGQDLESLRVATVFTEAHAFFAHVHEIGATMRTRSGSTYKMPARLGFKTTWDRMEPKLIKDTNKAIHEALKPQGMTTSAS